MLNELSCVKPGITLKTRLKVQKFPLIPSSPSLSHYDHASLELIQTGGCKY